MYNNYINYNIYYIHTYIYIYIIILYIYTFIESCNLITLPVVSGKNIAATIARYLEPTKVSVDLTDDHGNTVGVVGVAAMGDGTWALGPDGPDGPGPKDIEPYLINLPSGYD